MDLAVLLVQSLGKESMVGWIFATVIITVLTSTVSWQRKSFANEQICLKPPTVFAYDILGLTFSFQIASKFKQQQVLPWTHKLFAQHNGTFACRILLQEYIWTCNPQNIKHLLATQFSNFTAANERIHLFAEFSTRGVLTFDGQAWTRARDQLRSPFAMSVKRFTGEIEIWERHFQKLVLGLPTNGRKVDLQQLLPSLMMDILSEFVLGDSLDSLSTDQTSNKKEVSEGLVLIKNCIARKGFAGPFHWMVGDLKFSGACKTTQLHLQRIAHQALIKVDERNSEDISETSRSFIEILALEEKDELVLRDQLSNVLLAGIDTTAGLICAAIWLLSRDERAMSKLRHEILTTCGSALPTCSTIKSMSYLRNVISETLRLFPPITFEARTANKDTTLPFGGGFDGKSPIAIRNGQKVIFSSYSSHRMTDIYGSDPEQFRPERWENIKANTPGYLPFHVGPRNCVGQQYASVMASYIITRLLQIYERIESEDEGDWVEKIGLTFENANGVLVSLFRE